jgi:glycosyltransferase involved in cell wall biosynthesis
LLPLPIHRKLQGYNLKKVFPKSQLVLVLTDIPYNFYQESMMVSVCMATKNGARFIREQIDSILPQLSDSDELVISDDCSEDGTYEILQSYRDARIRIYQNQESIGITKNYEVCLKLCVGDLIFLSDQDDVWRPEKVEEMKKHLRHFDLVISDCDIRSHALELKYPSFFTFNKSGRGLIRNLIKNSYMGSCMAFNRNVLNRAMPFPPNLPIHDMWIGLIGEIYFRVHFVRKSLMYHRRHSSNASSTGSASMLPWGHRFYNRYSIIKNLILHKYYA